MNRLYNYIVYYLHYCSDGGLPFYCVGDTAYISLGWYNNVTLREGIILDIDRLVRDVTRATYVRFVDFKTGSASSKIFVWIEEEGGYILDL